MHLVLNKAILLAKSTSSGEGMFSRQHSNGVAPMPPSTVYCDNCGASNRPEARFCVSCGKPQTLARGQANTSLTGLLAPHHLLKQRYRIIGQLGQGGFGAVYKTEDMHFGNAVRAVKEMAQGIVSLAKG